MITAVSYFVVMMFSANPNGEVNNYTLNSRMVGRASCESVLAEHVAVLGKMGIQMKVAECVVAKDHAQAKERALEIVAARPVEQAV